MNHPNTSNGDRALDLTDRASASPSDVPASESQIKVLVDTFYDEVRKDDLLGPVFTRQVKDWSVHLPKMYDFWSTVVLRTGRYTGRPFEAHQVIPGLTRAHFERWLELWGRVVTRTLPAESRPAFLDPAKRMAGSISSRVLARP